jgi:two-component system capsular synthesis sensor histidine kinase RcsC
VPDFEPLFPDSDCSAWQYLARFAGITGLVYALLARQFSAAYDLNRVFLIGSENLCMADFGLRDVPVERDDALKSLHERIVKYRNAPQDERGNNLLDKPGPAYGRGLFLCPDAGLSG